MPWGVFQPPRLTRYAASLRTSPDTGCFPGKIASMRGPVRRAVRHPVATSTGLVGNLEAERPDHRAAPAAWGRCAGGRPVPTATEHYFYWDQMEFLGSSACWKCPQP